MLGDGLDIASGPDMARSVIKVVSEQGLPTDEEETLIVLSAATPAELVATRALVQKYQATKRIILVNSKFDPMPRELREAQTAYSILPLLARPKDDASVTGSSNADATVTPKVVVMRRFPRDWEIFVDVTGKGFELATRIPPNQVGQQGPSMPAIAQAVQRFLQTKTP